MTSTVLRELREGELQNAQEVVQEFLSAFKAFALYPEDHVFCRTSLEKLGSRFNTFLSQFGDFSLTVAKSGFFYEGEKLYEGPREETNPAYLLTRDGVIRLDFLPGIETAELAALLRVLNRHRSAGDEAGGDIVTSLWSEELPHIEYEEVDIFALEDFDFDLATLKVSPDPEQGSGESLNEEGEQGERESGEEAAEDGGESMAAEGETVSNLLRMDQDVTLLELTPEEKDVLRSYVLDEERKDYSSDVIEVLLIILVSQKNREHFSQILEFLELMFFETMDKGWFHLAEKLCSNLLTIRNRLKELRPWAEGLINDFFLRLAGEEQWGEVGWVGNPGQLVLHRERLGSLWQVLRLLPPAVIKVLGPMSTRVDSGEIGIRNELYELIETKALQEPELLKDLLARGEEGLNLLLFPIVETLPAAVAADICLQMTRHPAVEVRRTGLNGYLTHARPPEAEALFHLFSDEDDVIMGRLLTFLLSRLEKEEAEALLLRYLDQAVAEGTRHPHMFEYYKALTECGSERAVRKLEKILLEGGMTKMFSDMNAVHKKGAALALRILGTEEAMEALRKGVKSLRPDVRFACRFALDKVK
ncbi:MAG: hypothetical protein Kow0089_02810 [Desulfobulbaceae bacterium]